MSDQRDPGSLPHIQADLQSRSRSASPQLDPKLFERSPYDRTLQLATATIADLDHLVELDRLCFGTLWSRDTYARELHSPNSDILLLRSQNIAISHPQATHPNHPNTDLNTDNLGTTHPSNTPPALGYGCVWAILDEAHITILGVHPEYRRQGFGDVLIYGLFLAAHQRGLTRATLEVSTQNHAAIALYEKIGFQQAGCRKGYYANGDDAAILWKSGLQHPSFRRDLDALMVGNREKIARSGWMLAESPSRS
jgi:ribosomal-protein-alanine N-acetyltransferase